jgi:glycosyltransferase involved in cell wall biosynthesis
MTKQRPKVAACIMVKNEGQSLAEWLAYNIVLGFDEILVYDNASTDSTAAIVRRARANDSRVRYFRWPDVPGQSPQVPAYNDALQRTTADWVAFIDIDEFIVLKEHDSIGDFLADFDEDTGAVCIHWLVFGSSGHETHDDDDLVIRRFTQCARPDFSVNRHVKSIVRPSAVRRMLVHAPELSRGQYRSSNGRVITLSVFARAVPVVDHPAQINHYVLKSREEYRVKTARGGAGYAADDPDRRSKFTEQFWAEHDRNETVDYAIVPMIPKVEEEIRRLMANNARDAGSEDLRLHGA